MNKYLHFTLKTIFDFFTVCVFALNTYQWGLTGSDTSAFWAGIFAVVIFINLVTKDAS